MQLLQGSCFDQAEPSQVEHFLRTRKLRKFTLKPEMLSVVNDGRQVLLRFSNGGCHEYPCREVFLEKLFRWHSVPYRLTRLLGIDSITELANDLFLAVRSPEVTVSVEDNQALSLVSARYSEISDLEVLTLAGRHGISRVSRSDRLFRICSEVRGEIEPVPGDICGFGFSVVNSETGFKALSIDHYLLRHVCSNGAVVRIPETNQKRGIHSGWRRGGLRTMLEESLECLDGLIPQLESRLKESSARAAGRTYLTTLENLSGLIGTPKAKTTLSHVGEHSSVFEVFNELTSFAKTLPIERRYLVERLAGELL